MNGAISRYDKTVAAKLFLTVYLISAFFFKPQTYFARFEFLTMSLVRYGTTSIDRIEQATGIPVTDKVVSRGQSYIAVTPGLAYLGLLTYWPYSRFLLPKIAQSLSLGPALELKITQYVMALGSVILCTALAIAVFFLILRLTGSSLSRSFFFAIMLYAGTPVVFYSLNLTNGQNVVEMSLLLVACFFLLLEWRRGTNPLLLLLSGFFFGLAFFVNITASFLLPVVAAYFWRTRRRRVWYWILGVAPGVLSLFAYNMTSFGSDLTAYHIAYRGWVPVTSLLGFWQVLLEFTLGWRVGLLFYCPLLLLFGFVLFGQRTSFPPGSTLFMAAVGIYTVGYSVLLQIFRVQQAGNSWYHTSGGGGPRYLLPIMPYLIYLLAGMDFTSASRRMLTSSLCLAALAINVPGLFWTGGQVWFLNNLLLFVKNGFNSYTVQMFGEVLSRAGLNLSGFSLYPAFFLVVVIVWWIWRGKEWFGTILRPESNPIERPAQHRAQS